MKNLLALSVLSTILVVFDVGGVSAQPVSTALQLRADTASPNQSIIQVQYRGRRGGRSRGRRNRRGRGGNVGLGIGAAIIGGLALSEAGRASRRQSHGDAWERCDRRFRSFEMSTGMYTGYDGVRRTCPYLR